MRIPVIFDRPESEETPPDHEDILLQVKDVKDTLASLGHLCIEVGFTLNIEKFHKEINLTAPDLVFNLVESVGGKGNLIFLAPVILDSMGIPYTGSKTDTIYRTSNKLFAKEWLEANGVPTPEYVSHEAINDTVEITGGEYIIKSVWEHASTGLDDSSVITAGSVSDLYREMDGRKDSLGGQCFAERYIGGREFNLSIIAGTGGPEVLPPAEMEFDSYEGCKRKIVGYDAKWNQGTFEYNHTVRTFSFTKDDQPLISVLKNLALRCWKIFRVRGYCRVDFRVDEQNRPWVLEINANPCISPDSGFMAAAGHAGLGPEDVIKRIISDIN